MKEVLIIKVFNRVSILCCEETTVAMAHLQHEICISRIDALLLDIII